MSLLLARAARSLGMCGRASTPTWAETPERRGPRHSHRELVQTPEREGWMLFLFLRPHPVQDAAVQEPGCGPMSPGPGGHLVLPSQQALSSALICPCCGQPGVCPGAGPWVLLWVLQAHPGCSFGSSAHL